MVSKNFRIIFLFLAAFASIDLLFFVPNVWAADITAAVKISVCGNDIQEGGEQCDGNDSGGKSCVYLGYKGGAVDCTASCGFDTSNCNTDAEATTTAVFTPSVGGSQTLSHEGREAGVSLPTDFYFESLRMEMFSYSSTTISESRPEPSGKQFLAKVYNLIFFDSSGNTVSALSKPATVVLTYLDSDISEIEDDTIKPYKSENGSSSWQLMSDFSLDTKNNSVTFTTSSFGWFALFGSTPVSSDISPSSNGSSVGGRRHIVDLPYVAYENVISRVNDLLAVFFNEKSDNGVEKNVKQNDKFSSPEESASISKTSANKAQTGNKNGPKDPNQNISRNELKIILMLLVIIGSVLVRFVRFL